MCMLYHYCSSMSITDSARGELIDFYNRGLGGVREVNRFGWNMDTLGGILRSLDDDRVLRHNI